MSGISPVTKLFSKPEVKQAMTATAKAPAAAEPVERGMAADRAARIRARRGARVLLSDARLGGDQDTLGSSPQA